MFYNKRAQEEFNVLIWNYLQESSFLEVCICKEKDGITDVAIEHCGNTSE